MEPKDLYKKYENLKNNLSDIGRLLWLRRQN